MTTRYWVIGGEYEGPDFRALVPGTETMAGPFESERKARTEWTRLSCGPDRGACATIRYAIAAESLH
ncbi:MAG: hypothetical protein JOZ90_02125 [Alphaproteobacteria bacterium]|nr:hypothetical protein [Alphaproteobacteria bacterium]MBV9370712.1 hypothetical protein [Alphaproteobacteria bacterium]MBV9899875.1 hypothetical protein [Alphaproteobacteria bacterium]